MNVVPLTADLLAQLDPQYTGELGEQFVRGCTAAYVALVDGKPVAAAGLLEMWAQRAHVWALFAPGMRSKWVHRYVREFIEACAYRRVEMIVAANDPTAARWAERLGFEREGLMRAALPKGSDAFMYARVRYG